MGFDFIVIAPLLQSHCGFSFVFGCGVSFLWVPMSSCQWLFSSSLWFWCSRKREWAHVLLLHHFERISTTLFLPEGSSISIFATLLPHIKTEQIFIMIPPIVETFSVFLLLSNSPQISWLGSEVHHDGTPSSCSSLFFLCFYYTLGLRPSRWLTIPLTGLHPFLFSLFKLRRQLHVHIPPCSMTMIIIAMVYVSLIPYLSLWGNIVILFYRQWCKESRGLP